MRCSKLNIQITIVFLISGLSSIGLMGQTFQETADSLANLLKSINDPQEKIDLLNDVSYAYRRVDAQKVFNYGKEAFELANKIGYIKGAAIARKNQGISHHKRNSPIDTTKYYYLEAARLAQQCDDFYTQAACNNNIALLYNQKQELYTSIQYYLKGISIFDENFKEDQRLKALMLANTSESYRYIGENEEALFYIEKAFEMAKRNNYRSIISMYSDDYGSILTSLKQYDKARQVFEEGLKMNEELQDFMSNAWLLNHYADLEITLGNDAHAYELSQQSFTLAKEKQVLDALLYSRLCLARIALRKKDYQESIQQCEIVIEEGYKIERDNFQQEARKLLSISLEKIGDTKGALNNLRTYQVLRDSILATEKIAVTEELNTRYHSQEKEQAIAFLEKEKSLQKNYISGLIVLSTFLLIAAFFIFYFLFKTRQKEKVIQGKNTELKKYIKYNLELENFAYIASHDIKTPLRTVVSFSQLLKSKAKSKLNEEEKECLAYVVNGTKEIESLINDLLKYSRVNREKINREKIDVHQFVEDVLEFNKNYLNEASVEVELDIQTPFVTADKIKLGQVLQNLILNGVKFRKPNERPHLHISSSIKNDQVLFRIKDNGIGIEKDYFEKIFLIFKKLNKKEEYKGSGIGLSICKKVIEMHEGKIWVESDFGKGTSFYFSLPYSLN